MVEAIEYDAGSRVKNFLFTVEVDNDERKMQSVSGLNLTVNDTEWSASTMEDVVSFPGHINSDDLTLTYVPTFEEATEGKPETPYGSFLLQIEINDEIMGRCRSADGMGVSNGSFENNECDKLTTQKLIGKRRYNEITIEQVYGIPGSAELEEWMNRLAHVAGPGGGPGTGDERFAQGVSGTLNEAVKTIIIRGMNRNKNPFLTFRAQGTWMSAYSPDDLDSSSEDVLLKSATLRPSSAEIVSGAGEGAFLDWINSAFTLPYKRDMTLRAYRRNSVSDLGEPVASWRFYNAWPNEVTLGTLDATSDDPFSIDATIVNEGFEKLGVIE